jgi:hypothetical protein
MKLQAKCRLLWPPTRDLPLTLFLACRTGKATFAPIFTLELKSASKGSFSIGSRERSLGCNLEDYMVLFLLGLPPWEGEGAAQTAVR